VDTASDSPFELRFEYRWLTTVGAMQFTLGNRLVYRVAAPPVLNQSFTKASVILTDPGLRNQFFQPLTVCVMPEGPAQVELANLVFRKAPEANNQGPVITAGASADGSSIGFSWTSATNQIYQLQTRDSLTEGTWSNVGAAMPGTGAALSATQPISRDQAQRYFRLSVTTAGGL
jgi:hypothetical protein